MATGVTEEQKEKLELRVTRDLCTEQASTQLHDEQQWLFK